jgi:hypothetical protein
VSFDVVAYLDARGISYSTGRNVSAGNVGIQCVYPACDDTSNHLGIGLDNALHNCWKCGGKGRMAKLIMMIDNCGYPEAMDVVRKFSTGYVPRPAGAEVVGEFMLPKFHTPDPTPAHAAYLAKRGYLPTDLTQYEIKYSGPVSFVETSQGRIHYRWRIIIPIFIDGVVVNFTSRDITGRANAKYKTAPDEIAIRPGREVVYNLDNAGSRIALVEGPMDVWRIGPGAVAMLGTSFTEEQLVLIASHRPERVYVVYDSGAADIAEELGRRIMRLVPRVDYLWLDGGDPDTMSGTDLAHLRRLLAV